MLDAAAVPAGGSLDVTPALTTSYTLTVASSLVATSDTRMLTVTVNPTPLPVSIDVFTATPAKIVKGGSVLLTWQVSNATEVALDGTRAAPVESRTVAPLATTTYVLTAQGQLDAQSAQVTVEVEDMSTGLLPDRGGFLCSLDRPPSKATRSYWLVIGLVIAIAARLRRRRR
jgi:hypothetical protein